VTRNPKTDPRTGDMWFRHDERLGPSVLEVVGVRSSGVDLQFFSPLCKHPEWYSYRHFISEVTRDADLLYTVDGGKNYTVKETK
jgi:hypothetical protein